MMFCLSDFEANAEKVLDRNAWNYYSSGVNQEITLRDNVAAYQRYRLRPRVLRDVSSVDMTTPLLGQKVAFPICASPTAYHRMAHPDGELATARALSRLGTCLTLSCWSTTSMEDVALASGQGLRWMQLDLFRDKELARNFIQRAEKAGYKALVVTLDIPALGKKPGEKNTFMIPPHLSLGNFCGSEIGSTVKYDNYNDVVQEAIDSAATWAKIDWLRQTTRLPIVLKGILTAEDAKEAVKHDIQGILVSNHGGRQLDGVLATIDALGEVVRAVQGRVEVYMDGGVRQGTDVLKALAMGAKAVFIGKPVLWGLAYKGEEGVVKVFEILRDEFKTAMMLSGCRMLSEIQPSHIVHESCLGSKL